VLDLEAEVHPGRAKGDREYLNIFETRTGTPFFQDVYVNGVRVMLVIGPTGTSKSVHANQMLALEQKYGVSRSSSISAAAMKVRSSYTVAASTG
jgi:type IV secretory pathway VirB4 component